MIKPDAKLLEQVRNIREFRTTVSMVRDMSERDIKHALRSVFTKMKHLLRLASDLRYCLKPVGEHDWIIAYDEMRTKPNHNETGFDFLTRICQTNRDTPLTEILKLKSEDSLLLIDISRLHGRSGHSDGTLCFLFRLAGPAGLMRIFFQAIIGLLSTRNPEGAFLYAALDMVKKQQALTKRGLWLTTSTTWLAEVLRVGLSDARADIEIVEVLHGATTKNVAPYFDWLHHQSKAQIVYVNLIAGMPRFPIQCTHLLTDNDGEIACNIRLWQENPEGVLIISPKKMHQLSIAVIGGTSTDADYSESSYFTKELLMVAALQKKTDCIIRYCVHPKHRSFQKDKIFSRMKEAGIEIAKRATQAEIIEARIVVGGLSTSLIEAALLGRPTFAFENLGDLFIPEIAELVYYSQDIDLLAVKVSQVANADQRIPMDTVVNTASELALKRYGLRLKPECV